MSIPRIQKTTRDSISILKPDNEKQDETMETTNEIEIRGTNYLIRRHFVSKRSSRDAIFTAVRNEAFKD